VMSPEEASEFWAKVAEEETARVRDEVKQVLEGKVPQPVSSALDVRAIERIRDRAIAKMAETACKGDRLNLDVCTRAVERECPKREYNSCPRRVVALEEQLARLQPAALTPPELLKGMGVPFKIACLVVGSAFEHRPVVAEVERWWRGPKQVLVLLGGNQIGKSTAAAALVWRLSGRFATTREITARRRDLLWMDALRRPQLLVIDDLGFEPLDERDEALAAVAGLISDAVDDGKRLILTANLAASEIRPRYGDRVAERIKKNGHVPELGED
jgi:hypothetical protein